MTVTAANTQVEKRDDLVTLTIDDIEVSVPKGTLIIRAAEMIGIQIPRFCDHPLLNPVGACRQCMVEIPDAGNGRGMPKPQASCTIEVAPGMVVRTQLSSPVAEKAQRGQMEFLLMNHPLDCPVCDKGGECPLQNQAMSNGQAETRFEDVKRTFAKPLPLSPNVLLDRERCVLCARCTRFSNQIAGDPMIEMLERGALQQVGIYEDEPFSSYFSGNTIQICPVGALTSADYRFRARPFDLVSTPTTCEHCASGCTLRSDTRRGAVMRRQAGDDPDVNEEWNCDKGRFAFDYVTADDRLTHPMVRGEDGQLRVASWVEALRVAAAGLTAAGDKVGVLPGGRLTTEDAFAYSKFARVVLGTNDIDSRARPSATDEELAFLGAAVAGSGIGVTYADLERASAVLLVDFEPEDESPIVFLRLRKAVSRGGTKVFSIAPLASRGLTKLGGILARTVPGAQAAVLAGMESGDADEDSLAVADALRGERAVILVGERAAESPGTLTAAHSLARATGARLAWVPRRAGERGAIDAGCLPTLLPGGRQVSDTEARVDVGTAWGATVPTAPGRSLPEILSAATSGDLAALVVGGVDPADLPDPAAAVAALDQVGFLVSLEIRASAVTERANVVFPVATAAEKPGSYTDWEGRERPFRATLPGTGNLSDLRVLSTLADAIGPRLGLADAAAARAELAELGQWDGGRPGLQAAEAAAAHSIAGANEAVLATWHELIDAGRMLDGERHLAATARPAVARVSPATARSLGLVFGGTANVQGPRGAVELPVEIEFAMADGVVWLPANSRAGGNARLVLGAGPGDVVQVTPGSAEAVDATTVTADPAVSSDRDVNEDRVVSDDRIVTEGPTVRAQPLASEHAVESPGDTSPTQGGAA